MAESKTRLIKDSEGVMRCPWCVADPLYTAYHDGEWGFPQTNDTRLFEKICLEGFQAGLSWLTILRKRENFRRAFHGFDIEAVARLSKRDVNRLLKDEGIIRHRGKIESTINNAQRARELVDECGSLASFIWSFEPPAHERPKRLDWDTLVKMTLSPQSIAMSKALKKRGWTFVGPTTMYALMQAAGLVNDHLTGCDMRKKAEEARRTAKRPVLRRPLESTMK